MTKWTFVFYMLLALFLCAGTGAVVEARDSSTAGRADDYVRLLQQVEELQRKMEEMNRTYQQEIQMLKSELARVKGPDEEILPVESATSEPTDEESLYGVIQSRTQRLLEKDGIVKGLELDVSVVVDTFYYHDTSDEGIAHIKEEISGFGHSHATENHGHHHDGIENGFNLRHIELGLSAAVDPYFRSWTTLAIEDGNSEIEEAVIQTSYLPYGLTLSGGKFYSGIGRINRQHSHEWDFLDQPLVYELLLGPHGLQEKGVQLTWLAPTPFYLLLGAEALNGENEKLFQKVASEEVPDKDGPRLWTGFLKAGPDLGDRHAMQLGLSLATGYHQEAHDGDGDGADDHWLHGRTRLWGADFVYKYDAKRSHGYGDFVLQAEYFHRKKDLELVQHDLKPDLAGRDRIDRQDGYYVQALYGFAPHWRAGLRWEQVGLTNDIRLPSSKTESYGSSNRAAAMLDWKLSEFSLLRFQTARGDFKVEEGDERLWELALQWQVTFGKHAAHTF